MKYLSILKLAFLMTAKCMKNRNKKQGDRSTQRSSAKSFKRLDFLWPIYTVLSFPTLRERGL